MPFADDYSLELSLEKMDEFSITRPEMTPPITDRNGQRSARDETKPRRPARETPPETAGGDTDTPSDDETSHQVDELA
jgi:hypothetical protein